MINNPFGKRSTLKPILAYQELDIYLFADEIISTFLTPKFLKESQVVPQSWQFEKPPEISSEKGEAIFTNKVAIYAKDGEIIFTEAIDSDRKSTVNICQLSKKWVNTFKDFNYSSVRIGFRSFFTFEGDKRSRFAQYIPSVVLSSNNFQSSSIEPIRGVVKLLFTNEKSNFVINVEDVLLEKEDGSPFAGATFSTDFSYDIDKSKDWEKLLQIEQFINDWEVYWEMYEDVVSEGFLKMKN